MILTDIDDRHMVQDSDEVWDDPEELEAWPRGKLRSRCWVQTYPPS